MAKQPIDIGVKFTGDASGFQKAATNVKDNTKALKQNIKETAGVFDELGGAIGGMGGEVTSLVAGLVTSMGAISLITAAVTGLALAWKRGQENVDLYLKSAEKLKYGGSGFNVDSETALKDAARRAKGGITEGSRLEAEAKNRLLIQKNLTEEQKAQLELQIKEGQQMQKDNSLLLDSMGKNKDIAISFQRQLDWKLKYRTLLKEEEALSDKIQGVDKVRWEGLEAELSKQRLIGKTTQDSAIAEKARTEANRIANILLVEKNASLDEEIRITTALANMTGTQEVVEQKLFDLQLQKTTNNKEYYNDLIKIDRLMQNGVKLQKEQLSDAKQFNTHNSEGYKLRNIVASTKGIKAINFRAGKLNANAPGIQGYGGMNIGEIATIIEEGKFQSSLEVMQNMVGSLESSFAQMFTSISSGSKTAFEDMAKAFTRSLQQMVAQMAAKAATFAILNILTGGSMTAAKGGMGLLKYITGSFANGTNFAPGGLALVGERGPELVNLPRGSQVIPNGGGNMKIEVIGKVRGRDLALVLTRYQSELMSNT